MAKVEILSISPLTENESKYHSCQMAACSNGSNPVWKVHLWIGCTGEGQASFASLSYMCHEHTVDIMNRYGYKQVEEQVKFEPVVLAEK